MAFEIKMAYLHICAKTNVGKNMFQIQLCIMIIIFEKMKLTGELVSIKNTGFC